MENEPHKDPWRRFDPPRSGADVWRDLKPGSVYRVNQDGVSWTVRSVYDKPKKIVKNVLTDGPDRG